MADSIRPRMSGSGKGFVTGLFRILVRILKTKIFWFTAFPLVIAYCGAGACTTYVPPNMVGVKQVYYGSNAGIRPDIYPSGLHFVTAGVERLHLFPRDIQIVHFSDSQEEAQADTKAAPAVKLVTSDGYTVVLDAAVLYRIEDAHRVFTEAGPGRAYEDKLVIPRADRVLRKTLGELNAEQFYAGPKRIEKSKLAHDQLTAELQPYGIKLEAVLISRYIYDQKYQALIEGRKVKDQSVFYQQAEAQFEIEKRIRDTVKAEGAALVQTEYADGAAKVQRLRSEATLYERKQASAGKLLVETAEAEGKRLLSDALLTQGAENIVGLRMAELLSGVRVLVLPSDGKDGLNPLDVGNLLNKLEVK